MELETIGTFFMNIISGAIQVKKISGSISFEELKEHYSDDI